MVFYVLDLILFVLIAITAYLLYKLKKKYDANFETLNKKLENEIEEDRKRIKAIGNALPRTTRDGSLGYKVSLK